MFTTKTNQIQRHQNIACWAGIFYIFATVAPIVTYPFIGFIMEDRSANLLSQIAEHENQVIIGGLIELIYALSVIGIITTLHPILGEHRPVLSLGYFSLRFLEAISVMLHSLILLCLLTISRDVAAMGIPSETSIHQTTGSLLLATREWTFLIGSGIVWSLSALILNLLLYQNRLLPQWLSVWGLVGGALSFIAYSLQFFDIQLSELFYLPIGVQEMVFAGWLIIRGINSHAKSQSL